MAIFGAVGSRAHPSASPSGLPVGAPDHKTEFEPHGARCDGRPGHAPARDGGWTYLVGSILLLGNQSVTPRTRLGAARFGHHAR